jgi:hypothetical protein
MTLRSEYALGNSPYNEFLFASVGEEKAGQSLTVLSALARLGFDPWKEAARLAALPRETAARAFAVSIAMLPEGDWKAADSDAIATRLVTSLPKPGQPVPAMPAMPDAHRLPSWLGPALFRWLLWGALAGLGILLGLQF